MTTSLELLLQDAKGLRDTIEAVCRSDAPLHARLTAYERNLRALEPHFAEAYDALVAQLTAAKAGAAAPKVGDMMPEFVLPSRTGQLERLSGLLASGAQVISFNRGYWCQFCEIELRALAQAQQRIAAAGGCVTVITPDRLNFLNRISEPAMDEFTFLSDVDNGYALDLGLVIWVGQQLQDMMRTDGLDLALFQGNGGWFLPLPATFVVNSDGRILARHVDPDYRKRMDIEAILAALRRA